MFAMKRNTDTSFDHTPYTVIIVSVVSYARYTNDSLSYILPFQRKNRIRCNMQAQRIDNTEGWERIFYPVDSDNEIAWTFSQKQAIKSSQNLATCSLRFFEISRKIIGTEGRESILRL